MYENLLKKQLKERSTLIGSWIQTGHAVNAEILAQAGFRWLAADCEHGEFEDADIGGFVRAVRQHDCVPLVRVKENAVLPIRRALDLGAEGVIVPLIETAEQARKAVEAANYFPVGVRGFAWHRGNNWGVEFDSYARDFSPVVMVMIESKLAVKNIDEIMAVDGVDGCFVGPYDMSGSYGIIGQTGHEIIKQACREVVQACAKFGKSAGLHVVVPSREIVKSAMEDGFTFLALGMDTYFMSNGASSALEMLK